MYKPEDNILGPKVPDRQPNANQGKLPIISKYKGIPSEIAEEFLKGRATPIDPEGAKQEMASREATLEHLKQSEMTREAQKEQGLSQRYAGLSEELRNNFPEAQQKANKLISDYLQGTGNIEGLTKEEVFVIGKAKQALAENPNAQAVDFSKEIDKRVFGNLIRRIAIDGLETKRKEDIYQNDQTRANKIREDLDLIPKGVKEETIPSDSPDNSSSKPISEIGGEKYKDLANVKKAEKNLLQSLNTGNPDWRGINSTLYSLLTTRSEFTEMLEANGNDATAIVEKFKAQLEQYKADKETIKKQMEGDSNYKFDDTGAWLGIDTRPEAPESSDVSIKAYATLPMGQTEFIKHLPDLAGRLRQLAIDSDDSIKVKVPSGAGVLSRNDTVVVHFKKGENAEQVQKILGEWMGKNGISEEEREMGRAKIAADPKELNPYDGKKMSFSDLVAVEITKWIQQNYGKYDNETLVSLASKYAIERSQKPPEIQKQSQ